MSQKERKLPLSGFSIKLLLKLLALKSLAAIYVHISSPVPNSSDWWLMT